MALIGLGCHRAPKILPDVTGRWNAVLTGFPAIYEFEGRSTTLTIKTGVYDIVLRGDYQQADGLIGVTYRSVESPGATPRFSRLTQDEYRHLLDQMVGERLTVVSKDELVLGHPGEPDLTLRRAASSR